jgi:hypothetical protein
MKIKIILSCIGMTIILLWIFILFWKNKYFNDIYFENNYQVSNHLLWKKNDIIKIHILNKEENKNITIDKDDISKVMDIQEILKDWKKYNKDQINISEKWKITIVGKLKNSHDWWKPNIKFESEDIPEKNTEIIEKWLFKEISWEIDFKNSQIWSDKTSLIELQWKNISELSILLINNFHIPVQKYNSWYFVSIWANMLNKWSYERYGITKNNKKIKWKSNLSVKQNSNSTGIYAITPSIIKSSKWWNIVLQWKWLDKILSIQLSNNIIFKQNQFIVLSPNVIAINIPKNIDVWVYYLNIVTPAKIISSESIQLEITY